MIYHRPQSLSEALNLLQHAPAETSVLYDLMLLPDDRRAGVIDLKDIGLADIHQSEQGATLGARVSLQALHQSEAVPALLRQTAHQEAPSTLRNMRTLGGVIQQGASSSRVLASLLVLEAVLSVQRGSETMWISLADWLAAPQPDGVLTALDIAADGITASEAVARTPADEPIVAAVGRRSAQGQIWLALCGVADYPLLVDPHAVGRLSPPSDFRGSAAYRQQMAHILTTRVMSQLGE